MLDMGSTIVRLRKQKNWSQDELATAIGSSRAMIGKYERNENTPSIEVAISMAKAFDVPLDYLIGNGKFTAFDKNMLQRLEDFEHLDPNTKNKVLDILDTFIRDAKARKAYAQ